MKKYVTSIACMAVAIAGLGFTSCSSTDEAEVNPNYNPVTREVTAKLVLNIAANHTGSRQTTAITQATTDQTFRGITDTKIFAHILGTDGKHLATDMAGDKVYDLGNAISSGNAFVEGDPAQNKSNRIFEIALPTGTNTLTFYGRAIKDGTPRTGYTFDEEFGKISFNLINAPNESHFDLTQRISNSDYTNLFLVEEELMAFVQNGIQLSGINGTLGANNVHVNVQYVNPVSGTTETSNDRVTWQDYYKKQLQGVATAGELLPLEEIMADAYKQFVTIGANELRAGSGKAVARTIGDLKTTLSRVASATPTSLREAQAKAVAEVIVDRIEKYFTGTGTSCQWKPLATILTNIQQEAPGKFAPDAATYFEALTTAGKDINKFPSGYRIPEGGTYMQFNGGNPVNASADNAAWEAYEFAYVTAFNTSGMGNPTDITPKSYTYPAELCYFGNSPIRTSNEEQTSANNIYPNGVSNWNDESKWAAHWTKNSHVISTTRSVAMVNDVNYGTALLQTTVRYNTNTLSDNRKHFFANEDANTFDVSNGDAGKFELVGIIVGGQCDKMGWDYTRFSSTDKFNKWLYDNAMNTGAGTLKSYTGNATNDKSVPNYTMVFDNYDSSLADNAQSSVYVALEFKNNTGKDFWGMDNIIQNGGTFYLVGMLSPASASNASLVLGDEYKDASGNYYHALPPYNADGTTKQAKRVFIQDHTTVADFVIGANSLKYAYLTVPDLRSSQISLGVSVDMKWETGLNFNEVILGGN